MNSIKILDKLIGFLNGKFVNKMRIENEMKSHFINIQTQF